MIVVIEKKYKHRFRLVRVFDFEGQKCVEVKPLDRGFNKDAGAYWPIDWVLFPGDQLEFGGLQ